MHAPGISETIELSEASESDAGEIAHMFRYTLQHDLPYLPHLHTSEEDLTFFTGRVLKECRVVSAKYSGKIVGFCAFRSEWIDHLYVLPKYQGQGIGSTLLMKAKMAFPFLQLWTFQKNIRARKFYESHGFLLIELTEGLGNEEKEPDARYEWHRPLTE